LDIAIINKINSSAICLFIDNIFKFIYNPIIIIILKSYIKIQ